MFNQKEYIEQWRKENIEHWKEYNKIYYQENKEKELERNKRWQKANKENRKNYSKEWKENNPEYKKQWQKNNKDKFIEYEKKYMKTEKGKANNQRGRYKRRAKMKTIINTLISQEWLDILERYNYKCAYCGCEFDENTLPTRDHIIPISRGGDNVKENIVPACKSCNSKKHNKIILKKERIYAT